MLEKEGHKRGGRRAYEGERYTKKRGEDRDRVGEGGDIQTERELDKGKAGRTM